MTTILPDTKKISTPTDTNVERPNYRVRTQHVQAFLKARYPDLFGPQPKPLAIGIHHVLLARHPDLDVSALKNAIALRCRWHQYLKALTQPGAMRYALDGNPAGEVTAEQAEAARTRLAQRKAAKKAKAKAKKPPKPPAQAAPPPASSPPVETPAPALPPPTATPAAATPLGRPILRLKKKPASPTDAVTRKEGAK